MADDGLDFLQRILAMPPAGAADAIRDGLGDAAAAELAADRRVIMSRARSPIWRLVFEDSGGDTQYADTLRTYLALALSHFSGHSRAFARWQTQKEGGTSPFGGHWFAMKWDHAEANPFRDDGDGFISRVDHLANAVENSPSDVLDGTVHQARAAAVTNILTDMMRRSPIRPPCRSVPAAAPP